MSNVLRFNDYYTTFVCSVLCNVRRLLNSDCSADLTDIKKSTKSGQHDGHYNLLLCFVLFDAIIFLQWENNNRNFPDYILAIRVNARSECSSSSHILSIYNTHTIIPIMISCAISS